MQTQASVGETPGQLGLVQADQHGQALLVREAAKQAEHRLGVARVQARHRLVREQHLRRVGERDGEGDPLLLAAGQLLRAVTGPVADVERMVDGVFDVAKYLPDAKLLGGLSLRDLIDRPFALLPEGSPMRRVIAPLFREGGIEAPADVVETASILTIVALLGESDTLAILPEEVVRFYEAQGTLARLSPALPAVMGVAGVTRVSRKPGCSARASTPSTVTASVSRTRS